MAICKLTIATTVDGNETNIVRMGKIEFVDERILLRYRDENAEVCVTLQEKSAYIERRGDYSLCLHLAQGERTLGKIGMGGSDGDLPVETRRVEYTIGEKSLRFFLHYRLLFGEERQDMRLQAEVQWKI